MGRLSWLLLLNGILQGWCQAQSRTGGALTDETHLTVSSSLTVPSIPQSHTPAPVAPVSPQVFDCDGKITLEACRQEVLTLKPILEKYGAGKLGDWKWVLVPSQQWELVLRKIGIDSDVPAFTVLEARVTFFDDTLIEGSPGRLSQLMDSWHLGRDGLLDLAVRHELSHAFCRDVNEERADHNARLLEKNQVVVCIPLRHSNK